MNIKDTLINKYNYSSQEAEIIADDLSKLDTNVMHIFEEWNASGNESSDIMFHGYSIDKLCTDYGMNFFAALITLDWIVKEPATALSAIKKGIM